jgi:prolyl-tRNA editing enzyme YbaK/EbsC (Cys-tRNA(Pro) deacylase)
MPEKFSENENLKNGRIAKSLMSQEELNRGFPMFVVPSKKKVNQPI